MIDKIYKTLLTLINKEIQGYVTPTEFNLLANNVQLEIFREYFEDENRDKNKNNRGLTNKGYSNLDFNQRKRIEQFSRFASITPESLESSSTSVILNLPTDLYFIVDDGITTSTGEVIEEVEKNQLNYLLKSISKPSLAYPVYEGFKDFIKIYPKTVAGVVNVNYLKTPSMPKWTFFTLSSGDPAYNPAANDFQDFELHDSEFSNIVVRMLKYFGINLRESEIIQVAEKLVNNNSIKDNQ